MRAFVLFLACSRKRKRGVSRGFKFCLDLVGRRDNLGETLLLASKILSRAFKLRELGLRVPRSLFGIAKTRRLVANKLFVRRVLARQARVLFSQRVDITLRCVVLLTETLVTLSLKVSGRLCGIRFSASRGRGFAMLVDLVLQFLDALKAITFELLEVMR